jgi:hypothetical protein
MNKIDITPTKVNPCQICGSKHLIAGVACSPLGPFSFNYCQICLAMGAENKGMIEATVEICGGIENVHPGLSLTFFDQIEDVYKDFRTGNIIPITMRDGESFLTKSDFMEFWL